jgi:pimeloyl-ACP methyl ester carboxylesterase
MPRSPKQRLDDLRPPNAFLMMLEGRAPWELAMMLAATPWLRKLPRGDGHPVLVFPGLGANDFTTVALRSFLDSLGYVTHPWGQGFNFGPRRGVLQRCNAEVRALFERHAQPVSLIGWSLGGIYARELAKELPDHARCVITLGTPFTGHPHATNEDDGADPAPAVRAHHVDLLAHRRHRRLALQRQRARAAGGEHRSARESRRPGHEPARAVRDRGPVGAAGGAVGTVRPGRRAALVLPRPPNG